MSKKSKSTTNQTTHNVTTPTNPEWVTNAVQGLTGRISSLANLDPQSLVAGANPLQQQAAQSAAGLQAPSGYGQANELINGAAGWGPLTYVPTFGHSESLLDGLDRYMSPYLGSVVDSSLRDYDFGAAQTRAQNRLALANDDTFGGSGGSIQTALSEDAIDRGRGALSSQLRNQGFESAAQLSNQDAQRRQDMGLANMSAQNAASQFNAQEYETMLQRRLQAGQALANTAAQQMNDQRANIASQAQMGDVLRQIEQQRLQAPISLLTTQSGLLNQLPLNLFNGSIQDGTMNSVTKTKESGFTLGELAQLAQAAAAFKH
jgi:hypothetical protein